MSPQRPYFQPQPPPHQSSTPHSQPRTQLPPYAPLPHTCLSTPKNCTQVSSSSSSHPTYRLCLSLLHMAASVLRPRCSQSPRGPGLLSSLLPTHTTIACLTVLPQGCSLLSRTFRRHPGFHRVDSCLDEVEGHVSSFHVHSGALLSGLPRLIFPSCKVSRTLLLRTGLHLLHGGFPGSSAPVLLSLVLCTV